MAYTTLSLLLLSLTPLLLLLSHQAEAQTPSAPAPSPPGPINITLILEQARQFSTFIRFLTVQTQVADQINNQVNNSNDGMTVFCPNDNAFNNLPSGTLNRLNDQQQVQLIQYHVLPKFYSFNDLLSVSNPVRTQANGQNGRNFGLNFTGQGNQLNVSTGVVEVPIYNTIRGNRPLALYQVDRVLLPLEFYEAEPPASAAPPPPATTTGGPTGPRTTPADPPSNDSGRMNVGVGLLAGLWLLCLGLLY